MVAMMNVVEENCWERKRRGRGQTGRAFGSAYKLGSVYSSAALEGSHQKGSDSVKQIKIRPFYFQKDRFNKIESEF